MFFDVFNIYFGDKLKQSAFPKKNCHILDTKLLINNVTRSNGVSFFEIS